MLKHFVLLKVRESTSEKILQEIFQLIQELRDDLPGIMSYIYGKNSESNSRNHGFNYGYSLAFVDDNYYQNYLEHPKQAIIQSKITEITATTDNLLIFDHELVLEGIHHA